MTGKYVRKVDAHSVPLPVLDLFAGCKALEDSDGSWNGGDIVEWITDYLSRYGLDAEKPLSHYIGERKDHPYAKPLHDSRVSAVIMANIANAFEREAENTEDHQCYYCESYIVDLGAGWVDPMGNTVCARRPYRRGTPRRHFPEDDD